MGLTKWLIVMASLLLTTAEPQSDTRHQSRETQDTAATEPKRVFAFHIFPEGEKQISVPAFEQLPAPFQQAVRETRCAIGSPHAPYERTSGTLFRSTDRRQAPVYAILPCKFDGRNLDSLYILNRSGVGATLLSLAVLTEEGGIIASTYFGLMSWDPGTGLPTVREVTDMVGNMVHRYQYTLSGWKEPWGSLALVRIQKAKMANNMGEDDWQKVWEAPEWGRSVP